MEIDNPVLDRGFAVAGQTRQLTSYAPPAPPPPKKVSARIAELIAELGLRYRPTSQADLEAHAEALRLLTQDLADMPPRLLERAIQQHVTRSPYMPKASDLITLSQRILDGERPQVSTGETMAQRGNRMMSADHVRRMRWVDDPDGGAHLEAIGDW